MVIVLVEGDQRVVECVEDSERNSEDEQTPTPCVLPDCVPDSHPKAPAAVASGEPIGYLRFPLCVDTGVLKVGLTVCE